MRKPDFIIVGAHKAGTTSLHYYLDEHPDIYLPDYKGGDLLSHRDFKQLGKTVTVPGITLAERSRSQNPTRMSPSTPLRGRLRENPSLLRSV